MLTQYPTCHRLWRCNNRSFFMMLVAVVLALTGFSAVPTAALAAVNMNDVNLIAVTRTKAIVKVRGKQYVLKVGESTPEGVRLIKSGIDGALMSNGVREDLIPLELVNVDVDRGTPSDEQVLILHADQRGSFHANGKIHGKSLRFLVDTGASLIALSSVTAKKLGIDTSRGRRGRAATASGTTGMIMVMLDKVEIGDITVYNVEAGILDGAYPKTPLLGMSFLSEVTMHREGNIMELTAE